jgi:hypothetical protein
VGSLEEAVNVSTEKRLFDRDVDFKKIPGHLSCDITDAKLKPFLSGDKYISVFFTSENSLVGDSPLLVAFTNCEMQFAFNPFCRLRQVDYWRKPV